LQAALENWLNTFASDRRFDEIGDRVDDVFLAFWLR